MWQDPFGRGDGHCGVRAWLRRLCHHPGRTLARIRASFQREAEHSEAELLETVCGVELLILDDLGMEKPTAWARERLTYVVNQRYAANLATVVSTNLG